MNDNHPNYFHVINMDEFGNKAMEGTIQVTEAYLTLHQLERDPVSWPLRYLRRFGFEEGVFIFESGRHGPTGQGIFTFRCSRAEQLFSLVQAHVRSPNLASVSESNNWINQARRSRAQAAKNQEPIRPQNPSTEQEGPQGRRDSQEVEPLGVGLDSHMYMNVDCSHEPITNPMFPDGQMEAPVPEASPPQPPTDCPKGSGNHNNMREYQNIVTCPEQPILPPKPTPQTPNSIQTPEAEDAFAFNRSLEEISNSVEEESQSNHPLVYAELELENTPSQAQQDLISGISCASSKITRYATIDLHKTQALNTTAKLQSQRSMEAFAISSTVSAAGSLGPTVTSNGVKEVVKRLKLSQSIVSNS